MVFVLFGWGDTKNQSDIWDFLAVFEHVEIDLKPQALRAIFTSNIFRNFCHKKLLAPETNKKITAVHPWNQPPNHLEDHTR